MYRYFEWQIRHHDPDCFPALHDGPFGHYIEQNVFTLQSLLSLPGSSPLSGAASVKNTWNIKDLLDLHHFMQVDEDVRRREGEEALAKRDRHIYLAKIKPRLDAATGHFPPRLLAWQWLAVRRLQYSRETDHASEPLPGNLWEEFSSVCQWLIFFIGLLAGGGLAGSLLIYSGTAPVNVSVYLGLFVLLQLLLLGLQTLFFLQRKLRRTGLESSVLYALIGRLLIRGVDWLRRRVQRKMSGRQRLDLAGLFGEGRQRREHATLLVWPAFILAQLGGIGFNLGVLGATLGKVVFSDIAFGWQSSLQLSAEAVVRLVQAIALPWSWFLPAAYPGLEQIRGSQMVLKEGMYHLTTGDLVSWWPFLCCAVVVYGLLPRLILLGLGVVQRRRALERMPFSAAGLRRLVRRMLTPRIDASGADTTRRTPLAVLPSGKNEELDGPAIVVSWAEPTDETGTWFALIPDELYADCPPGILTELLLHHTGTPAIQPLRYGVPGVTEEMSLAPLVESAGKGRLAGILFLQEAWQPPLRETASLFRNLRRIAGNEIPIIILLIGKPSAQTIFTEVSAEHLEIWKKTMHMDGDPNLDIIPLVQR
jgi:hypothetical protein